MWLLENIRVCSNKMFGIQLIYFFRCCSSLLTTSLTLKVRLSVSPSAFAVHTCSLFFAGRSIIAKKSVPMDRYIYGYFTSGFLPCLDLLINYVDLKRTLLQVDGEEVQNHRSIEYRKDHTPKIRDVLPRYGKPGDTVTLAGKLFTKEYGNANFGDKGKVNDRREESITAVMMGSKDCELTDDLGNVYDMDLDSPTSNEGHVMCKPSGSFIGPMNATIFVSGKYGKSQVDDDTNGYSVNSKNQLFMYHTLPEVTSISPNIGATSGSTHLTIKGNSFDAYGNNTVVKIGKMPCKIVEISNNELVCSTPAEKNFKDDKAGPRGLKYEMWMSTEINIADTFSLLDSAEDYVHMTLDGSTVSGPYFGETNGFTAKLSGYFVAPYSGNISFYLITSDQGKLFLSPDDDPANKVEIVSHESAKTEIQAGKPHSAQITVKEGNSYYIEAIHVQRSSSASKNNLEIAFWEHKTIYHTKQTSKAIDERQRLHMKYKRKFETQTITFNNIPNDKEIFFTHKGMKAKSSLSLAAVDQLGSVMTGLLTYTCEYLNSASQYKNDFEDGKMLPGQWGTVKENIQAYCGKKALKNHWLVFKNHRNPINAGRTPWFCFAAIGTTYQGVVQLRVKWTDNNNSPRVDWQDVKNVWTPSNEWTYNCLNMFDTVKNETINWMRPKENTKIEITEIRLKEGVRLGDNYMDEITISAAPVEIERKEPALADDNVMVRQVNVVNGEAESSYDIEIVPWTCNPEEEDFSLFGILNSEIVGLDTSSLSGIEKEKAIKNYLHSNDKAVFSSSSWGSGTVKVERKIRGSRATKGTMDLFYGGKKVSLEPHPTVKTLSSALEAFGMIGASLWYSGEYENCYDRIIDIRFDNSDLSGDIEEVKLDSTNLITDVNKNVSNSVHYRWSTISNGGIMVRNPGGDFFRKPSKGREITVSVGGFLSSCSAVDCSFQYSSSFNPTLDDVTLSENILTITGTGFSESLFENIVSVGNLGCNVFMVTSDGEKISCELEAGPVGSYNVSVVVAKKGLAISNGQKTIDIPLEIINNEPTEGSLGGGTTVKVNGTGFPASMKEWKTGAVVIAGSVCKVLETSYSSFKCITSSSSHGRKRRSTSTISITINGKTVTGGYFTYSASLTPAVSKLSTYSSSPLGGEILTIEGSAFGVDWGKVYIGEKMCNIVSWLHDIITCKIPSNTHGTYPVHVSVKGNGYADVTGIQGLTYTFVVKSMSPRKGSLMGGTKVLIGGEGFGNCSNVKVSLSEIFDCNIQDCNDSEITCITERKSNVFKINNGGIHPVYGPGYVWSQTDLTINPGDIVNWIWNIQVKSKESKISLHQTASSSTDEYNGNGFKSIASANGRFSKRFMNTGVYYYSTDPVFRGNLFMKGVIRVVAPTEDEQASLKVIMADMIEAKQEISNDVSNMAFEGCTVEGGTACAEDPLSIENYIFLGADCLTPVINSIDVVEGEVNSNISSLALYNGAKLHLQGTGFSENACQNDVRIGDSKCKIEGGTSATEILCIVDGSNGNITSLTDHMLTLNILNKGNAVLETSGYTDIQIMPKIESVSLRSGSWAGGSIYVLAGSGLLPLGGKNTTLITFGEFPYSTGCTVVEVTFLRISCVVPDFSKHKGDKSSMTVDVTVHMGYDGITPEIDTDPLNYEFTDSLTSTATGVDISEIVVGDSVTISGTNFGSSARVFLTKADTARYRRRAPISKRDVSMFEVVEFNENENHFWSIISSSPINWKCASGSCNHDALLQSISAEEYSRRKRSIEEEEEEEGDLFDEGSFQSLLDEICGDDGDSFLCSDMIEHQFSTMMGESHIIFKRSADDKQEDIIEMSIEGQKYEATVTSVTSDAISFNAPATPAGKYDVIVFVEGQGNSISELSQITSNMVINSVTPSQGSIHGGQKIKIDGSGFCTTESKTSAKIGQSNCEILEVSPGSITCITSGGADGSATLSVSSCSVTATNDYTYSNSISPSISNISPESASGPVSLSISGSNFGSSSTVTVGPHSCEVTSSDDASVSCNLGALSGGNYAVVVHNSDIGFSDDNTIFESTLNIDKISPALGSFGGGLLVTILGTGFDVDGVSINICDDECKIVTKTTTNITCLSPANSSADQSLECDVIVTQDSGTITSTSSFVYDRSLTPTLDSVNPVRGGTGGGTEITVLGSGFASKGNKVTIDGSVCDIKSESETEIVCFTNYHAGPIEAAVVVDVPDQGYADYSDISAATFYYIDRWSSKWTWGGTGTPLAGEFIVITNGQTILLDKSTPTLKFLLVKGGTLIFDREQSEIELNTEYILLVEGGRIEIGTEDEPYDSKAIITMHGNVRCTELPIFGCKVCRL